MRFLLTTFICALLLTSILWPQDNTITVIGDQLLGRMENGESIREVVGNVVLTQGNVRITCNKAIQFLARNNAHLIGNVIITQDTLTIYTDEGFYFGNEKRAYSDRGVTLNDKKVVLTAGIGEYLFNNQQANFNRDVKLTDTLNILTCNRLTYFRRINKAIAVESVAITDTGGNVITADSLINQRDTRTTFAFFNVRVRNLRDNSVILGEHLEDYRQRNYSRVDVNPLFLQVDTVKIPGDSSKMKSKSDIVPDSIVQIDTLVIKALLMESFRNDSSDTFIATDSVNILRGGFASANDKTIFYRDKEKITINKLSDSSKVPIIWYDNSQLTGDSITIYLKEQRINKINVDGNAFLISQSEINRARYDQLGGKRVILNFIDNALNKTEVFGNVLGIYYMFEDLEQNGLMKASSREAVINFDNKKVSQVNLYGDPNSEYHPENIVEQNEKSYTLPGFVIHSGRPTSQSIFTRKFEKLF